MQRQKSSAPKDDVEVLSRAELAFCQRWARVFAGERKDHRYYELVEDTLRQGFEFQYFVLKDQRGDARAVQPVFLLEQDIFAGAGPRLRKLTGFIRRLFPNLMRMRTLMVGCVAGEGHLDGDDSSQPANARLLASAVMAHARDLKASLIVLKEFPAKYRAPLACFLEYGFARVPSFPMTRLDINYSSFEEYMKQALNNVTRHKLRRNFRAAEKAPPIEMSVVVDASPIVNDIYRLYLAVYERSGLHFEKLTKEYLCGIGQLMPDKVRFFLWRQEGRIVAFSLCMLDGDAISAEYIGLNYAIALDLHLYHYELCGNLGDDGVMKAA
jgi:hypothetical protein